jgi:hypothetical protein
MKDDELLLAISDLMDKKLHPLEAKIERVEDSLHNKIDLVEQALTSEIVKLDNKIDAVEQALTSEIVKLDNKIDAVDKNLQNQITRINLFNENVVMPRLQTIESCYLSTYERYKDRNEQIDQLQLDISVIKRVVIDHGEQLRKIS